MPNIIFHAKKEQSDLIEGLIQSGEFKTRDEALTAAVKLLEGQNNAKLQRLRRLIDEGLNSGSAEEWNADDFLKEVKLELNG